MECYSHGTLEKKIFSVFTCEISVRIVARNTILKSEKFPFIWRGRKMGDLQSYDAHFSLIEEIEFAGLLFPYLFNLYSMQSLTNEWIYI